MGNLQESVILEYLDPNRRVDAEQGVLYGVKLLGEESRNGRKYKPTALRSALPLYEGRKSYLNHNRKSPERPYQEWIGVFRNVRYVEGKGIFGDAHLRQKSGLFEGIIEAAEKFPNDVGFSHVANGKSHMEGTTEIVESISEVFSVDLVTDPATTAGIFEAVMSKTNLKEFSESLEDNSQARKLLTEAIGLGLDAATELEGEQDAILCESLTQACSFLLSKLQESQESVSALQEAASANTESHIEESTQQELEGLKLEVSRLKAKSMLLESGREATEVRINALATADESQRTELLESWPAASEAYRPSSSPPLRESDSSGAADFHFDKPGSFAARYR